MSFRKSHNKIDLDENKTKRSDGWVYKHLKEHILKQVGYETKDQTIGEGNDRMRLKEQNSPPIFGLENL